MAPDETMPTAFDVLLASRVDRPGVNAEEPRRAGRHLVQIKAAQPGPSPSHGVSLSIVAVVPDKVDRPCLAAQLSGQAFYSVAMHKDHACFYAGTTGRVHSNEG